MAKKRRPAPIHLVERMLYDHAWRTWRRLPPQTQKWIDVEDLYQDAAYVAVRCWVAWSPTKGASYETLVYGSVARYFNTLVAKWKSRCHSQLMQSDFDETRDDWIKIEGKVDLIIDSVVHAIYKVTLKHYSRDSVLEAFGLAESVTTTRKI